MKSIRIVALVLVICAVAFAQTQQRGAGQAAQGAAQAARGGQRGTPPPEDPRDMGGGRCAENPVNCKDTTNPIASVDSVWMEELTWIEVRDAVKNGKDTVIIATGGMEPNGPYLVTGKHNYVLHANCEAIARKMGNALCAPIIKFVPEGDLEPPTIHMKSPGTISMREETFRMMLEDTARSLQKSTGFKSIIFIGDSGGNQAGMKAVAEKLNKEWPNVVVAHIAEYYTYNQVSQYMQGQGIKTDPEKSDHLHDDPIITLNMFIDDPKSVRFDQRVKANKATINGFSIADRKKSTELAKKIVDFRANQTIEAIKKAVAAKRGGTNN
jgi:creatinine amidohydrolase